MQTLKNVVFYLLVGVAWTSNAFAGEPFHPMVSVQSFFGRLAAYFGF